MDSVPGGGACATYLYSFRVAARTAAVAAWCVALSCVPQGVVAATPDPGVTQEQILRAQQQEQERQQRQSEPVVRLQPQGVDAALTLPAESPCHPVNELVLQLAPGLSPAVERAGRRALGTEDLIGGGDWIDLWRTLQAYRGRCIGSQGVNLIVHRAAAWLIDHGYSTSRVGLLQGQDLSQGRLALMLIPGVLGHLRAEGADADLRWRSAFPIDDGDLLNLRALEQGLEQMKRVPSQDVDMQIVPGDDLGVSDVVVSIRRTSPVRLSTSLNDAGQPSTGTYMAAVNFLVDNLLGRSDILTTSYTQNVFSDDRMSGNQVESWYYALPWGYATWSASQSRSFYRLVTGPQQLLRSRGDATTQDLRVDYVVQRDEAQRNTAYLRLASYQAHAFVNDVEVVGQRENRIAEWGWLHKHYLGTAQLDLQFSQRFGLPGLGGQEDYALARSGGPTFFYEVDSLDVSLAVPWQAGPFNLRYSGTFHGQSSPNALYATEYLSIGSRYNVRGFNGVTSMLGAESGAWWRNDLDIRPRGWDVSVYLGVDAGKVYGPGTASLPGTQLVGAVIGTRGSFARGHYFDLFCGTALQQPASFKTDSPVVGGLWTWELR